MGGSKSTTTTKIPKEIRQRGSQITNGAMGSYFDPGQRYTGFNYGGTGAGQNAPSGSDAGNYDWSGVGQATTGQLNGYHTQAGQNISTANTAYNNAGTSYQPYINSAGQAASTAQGNTAGIVNMPDFNQANLSKFFNPYQQNVIDQGRRQIGDAMTQGRLENQSRAGLAGAFGGTRHAVLDSLNQSNAMTTLSDFVGSQLAQGYGQAVNQYNTDYGQQLSAQGLNNQAAGQNYGQGMQYANFLQGLGQQQQTQDIAAGDAQLKAAEAAKSLGNIYTAQDEAQKQNAYQYGYLDARNYPLEVYERLAGINAMQPVNRTSTTKSSGGWLGPAIGAAGSIMASDERLKESVDDIDPEEVLGAFSQVRPKTYTYKAEAREAFPEATADGRRRGFMAQDYEKAFKRKNVDMGGGYQGMDVANVLGDLVAAVHGLEARTRKLKKRAH
jgi:hypothetical protein